jgi:hypothetical protein
MSEFGKGYWMGAIVAGTMWLILVSLGRNSGPKVNHPEGSEPHIVYQMMRKDKDGVVRNHLFMGFDLFKRSVECAKQNDGCRDTLILNEPAEVNLGGKK